MSDRDDPELVADGGEWVPMEVQEAAELFSGAPFRWWIAGGHALELHTVRSWRAHDDLDVGVRRQDASQLYEWLAGWDLHVAAAGELRPWKGDRLSADQHENNVWARRSPGARSRGKA
ncbi:MAG: hypothetical protein WB239_07460 [Acidimicrobiia bacterium]